MSEKFEIYLDANATTQVLPLAQNAALEMMDTLPGNPSSIHTAGLRAKEKLDQARDIAGSVVGVPANTLIFTSGATEGTQTAVLSALQNIRQQKKKDAVVLYGATEHKVVPESLKHWTKMFDMDIELIAIPVLSDGRHDIGFIRQYASRAALVCIMAANNETGTISDLAAIRCCLDEEQSDALLFSDSVQGLGKLHLQLSELRVDYATFSGHKLHAPKGVGLLYVRDGAPYTTMLAGGGQESGRRCGTENLAGIVAFGAVLKELRDGSTFRKMDDLLPMQAALWVALEDAFPGLIRHSPSQHCLPTTLNFSVPGLTGKQLQDAFDAAGVRISAGSACSARKAQPSYVLEAMGVPKVQAASAIRVSFSPINTDDEIQQACIRIRECGDALRELRTATLLNIAPQFYALPCENIQSNSLPTLGVEMDVADLISSDKQDLLLVDVREEFEHVLSDVAFPSNLIALRLPLSQLTPQLHTWAKEQTKQIVFLCRTGHRSLQAVQSLRLLGHDTCWHVAGGLALWTDRCES